MDSGQISLDTIETSGLDPNINYMFDCVWLVTCRYHTYGSDGKELPPKMFLSVLEANLVEGKPTTSLFSYVSIVTFCDGCFPISVIKKPSVCQTYALPGKVLNNSFYFSLGVYLPVESSLVICNEQTKETASGNWIFLLHL